MEYNYVRCMAAEVNEIMAYYAAQGWKINTFNRLPGASVIDILFEREDS